MLLRDYVKLNYFENYTVHGKYARENTDYKWYKDSNTVKVFARINKDYKVPCESVNRYQDDVKNYLQQFCMLSLNL